jgi:hypothetical protein
MFLSIYDDAGALEGKCLAFSQFSLLLELKSEKRRKKAPALFSCQFNINRRRVNNTISRDGVSLFCVTVRALR